MGSSRLDPRAQQPRRQLNPTDKRQKQKRLISLASLAVFASTVPLTHSRTRTVLTHAPIRPHQAAGSPKDSAVRMCALLSSTNGMIVKSNFALCVTDSISTTYHSATQGRRLLSAEASRFVEMLNSGDFFRIRQGGGRQMTS